MSKDPLYVPGEQPDPAFVAFYNGPWSAALAAVRIPGMRHDGISGPSWDRRAAYLLWLNTDNGRTLAAPSPTSTPVVSDLSHGVFD